jgi:hypothetical protein
MTRVVRLAAAGTHEGPVGRAPTAPVPALEGAPGYGTGGARALTAATRGGGPGDPSSPSRLVPGAEGCGQDGVLR